MKIIEKVSDMIQEEIADAEKYIRCALMHKEDFPTLADTFYKLSGEEITHMNMLHDQVTEIIANYRREHGEPPASMMAVYEYLHRKQIDKVAEVKTLWGMYKS